MAHALNEVRSGVRTWPWTLCHGWGPLHGAATEPPGLHSPRGPALPDQVATTRRRLLAMPPKEPDLGRGSPPSAESTRQSTALLLPDPGGGCRLACNVPTILRFPYGKAGPRPSSGGSPKPPARASAEGTALSAWIGLMRTPTRMSLGQSPHRNGARGPEGADRKPYCAPHPGWGLGPTQLSGEPLPHTPYKANLLVTLLPILRGPAGRG